MVQKKRILLKKIQFLRLPCSETYQLKKCGVLGSSTRAAHVRIVLSVVFDLQTVHSGRKRHVQRIRLHLHARETNLVLGCQHVTTEEEKPAAAGPHDQ